MRPIFFSPDRMRNFQVYKYLTFFVGKSKRLGRYMAVEFFQIADTKKPSANNLVNNS